MANTKKKEGNKMVEEGKKKKEQTRQPFLKSKKRQKKT